MINLKLEKFEGPFDLLFHLIEKAEIHIYDIPMAVITEQYFQYLNAMELLDLEIASEFLLMAATLLEIKSKMLLPKLPKEEVEDTVDPRDELVQKLIEYKKFKEASLELKEKMSIHEKALFKVPEAIEQYYSTYIELPDMHIDLLYQSFHNILARVAQREKEDKLQHHIVKDEATIEDKIRMIKLVLEEHSSIQLEIFFEDCQTKMEAIITFLAVLELVKIGWIAVTQHATFSSILIERVVAGYGD